MALMLACAIAGFLSALGLGLLFVADTERRMAAHSAYAVETAAAADAALERAIVDLRGSGSWSAILVGTRLSTFVDGTRRPRLPAGGDLDLDAATAAVQAESDAAGRLGANTPQWRLFAWGPLSALAAPGLEASAVYLAVWVADDAADDDGDPWADSNGTMSLRAEARGPGGARRAVIATVTRSAARVRVMAWREVS